MRSSLLVCNDAMIMRSLARRIPIRGRGYDVVVQSCGALACNLYALICLTTREAAIIDPSFSRPSEFRLLHEYLRETSVQHILLTHGHPDHVVGVTECLRHWPHASLGLHPWEDENYRSARHLGHVFGLDMPETFPAATRSLWDGDVITVGSSIRLRVLHTPGHAPGHVAFVDDRRYKGSDGAVIWGGDLLFRGSVGRTDFANASSEDLCVSLGRLYELFSDESIVLSGHTTPTTLGTEKQSNLFVQKVLKRSNEWLEESKQRMGWSKW